MRNPYGKAEEKKEASLTRKKYPQRESAEKMRAHFSNDSG